MESFVEVECADDGIDSMTCQSQCTRVFPHVNDHIGYALMPHNRKRAKRSTYTVDYVTSHYHMSTYIHACMHACIHTYIHTYMHTYIHTYTYICMCECVNTYACTIPDR